MKKYEITFIVGENYTEDKAKDIANDIRKIFEAQGAKIEKEFYWGKRKMTYKIAKNTFGYYFIIIFDLEPSKINEINQELQHNERLIRYLVVDFIENSPFFELEGGKGDKKRPVVQENTHPVKEKRTVPKIEPEKEEAVVEEKIEEPIVEEIVEVPAVE